MAPPAGGPCATRPPAPSPGAGLPALTRRPGGARRRRPPRPPCDRRWPPPHQRVGVRVAERRGHLVLLLEEEPVLLAAGAPVELDPHRGQHAPGVVDGHGVDVVGQDRHSPHHGGAGRRCPAGPRGTPSGRARAGSRHPRGAVALGDQVGRGPAARGASACAHRSRAPSSTGSATLESPQTTRPSSRPRATRRSSPAISRASPGRRTLWSSEIPSSHTGYQIRSAVAETLRRAPVDEHHVEVAERAELAPAVAAHRHQGQPRGRRRWPGRTGPVSHSSAASA